MITRGFITSQVHKGIKSTFIRKLGDGQDVSILVSTRTTDTVQDSNPFNSGFSETETLKSKRVLARYVASLSRNTVTNPFEEKIFTRLGLKLEGDLLIVGKYDDFEDFKNTTELIYNDERYILHKIQPGFNVGDNDPYLFAALFNIKERSTN